MDLTAYAVFDAGDPRRAEELHSKFNLLTSSAGRRNRIFIHPDAKPMAAALHFHGQDNEVVIGPGGQFRGELIFLESRSRVIIHDNVRANTLQATLYSDSELIIGAKTVCYGLRVWVSSDTFIKIGEGCLISEGVSIRTSDHHSIFDIDNLSHLNTPESITIDPCVWLGQDVLVLKGVRVCVGAIIGARSLVTRSVPPMELWSGSPARMMRQRVSWDSSLPAPPKRLRARLSQLKTLLPIDDSYLQPQELGATYSRKSAVRKWMDEFSRVLRRRDEKASHQEAQPPVVIISAGSVPSVNEPTPTHEWIDAIYRKVLMRAPEDGAVDLHARRAISENTSPAEILDGMFRCDEFKLIAPEFISTYVPPQHHLADHSQSGEATFLVKQLVNEAATHKFVVDVGARGRSRSNSYDILRCFGWRGILIEANPNLIEDIREDFLGLDAKLINCAVADYDGEADFFFGVNDDVSSLHRQNSAGWGKLRGQCKVLVRRLSSILEEINAPLHFDLLSLDIEGYDIAVLSDLISNSAYRPKRIIIEMHQPELVADLNAAGFHPVIAKEYRLTGYVGANLFLTRKHDQFEVIPQPIHAALSGSGHSGTICT